MNNLLKLFLVVGFSCFYATCYAIEVDVQSPEQVSGIGFAVQGQEYGWMGNSYSNNNAPPGVYYFGVRVNGSDISCPVNGRRGIELTNDTSVTLHVKGDRCSGSLQSM